MYMSIFKERLRELRLEKGLSQRQLAESLEMKHANISRWESGLQDPTSVNIIKIARFFGVTTDYLLGEQDC